MKPLLTRVCDVLPSHFRKGSARLRNSLTLSGLRIVDVLAGLAKDITLLRFFGLGMFMDAYFVAISFVDLVSLYFQSVSSSILVPLYSEQSQKDIPKEEVLKQQHRLVSVFINYLISSMLILAAIIAIFHRQIGHLVAPGLAQHPDSHLEILLLILLPLSIIFQASYALRLIVLQNEQYSQYYLPGIISTLLFILGVTGLYPSIGYWSVVWVFPLSQLVQFLMYWKCLSIPWQPVWNTPEINRMFRYALPATITTVLLILFPLVDNFFLAQLPEGELSAYRYAAKIVSVLSATTIASFQMTLIPTLIRAGSDRDYPLIRNLVFKNIRESLLFSLAIIPVAYFLAPLAIELVFQRGSFDAQDTQTVSRYLRIVLFQLPFLASWLILIRGFHSLYLFRPLLILAVTALALRGLLDWIGLYYLGPDGIAWMTTLQTYLMLAIGVILLLGSMRKLEKASY